MAYRLRYDKEADVLSVVLKEKGKFSHAVEAGDVILHVDASGKALFIEVLNASKVIPMMAEAIAKGKAVVAS